VRYRANGVGRELGECHCAQCRKQAGHRHASAYTTQDNVAIEGADAITWFRASPLAERGFCSTCGSHLFWKASPVDYIGIAAASIDDPSGLRLAKHIFVADKPAYYDIDDGLPQFPAYDKPFPPE
jgi:hypothetical protein